MLIRIRPHCYLLISYGCNMINPPFQSLEDNICFNLLQQSEGLSIDYVIYKDNMNNGWTAVFLNVIENS